MKRMILAMGAAGTLASLTPNERRVLIAELQGLTAPGGLHALVPDAQGSGPEGLAGHYASWQRESIPHSGRRTRGAQSRGALFVRTVAAADVAVRDARA